MLRFGMGARMVWALVLTAAMMSLLATSVIAAPRAPARDGGSSPNVVVDGTNCGRVTAFTAPTLTTDGTITIDGVVETIDAGTMIDATTLARLATIASLDAFTCLELEVDADGDITAISIAATARVCGVVDATATGYTVGDTVLSGEALDLVEADAALSALLEAAADANANVCLDLALNSAGVVTAVNLDASFDVCGQVTLTADGATVGGVTIPNSVLSAEAEAALALAAEVGATVCVDLTIQNTQIVSATVTLDINICGSVTVDAAGNVTVNGVEIPVELLDPAVVAALRLAATADVDACVAIAVDGDDVDATVTVTVCATVDAITDTTITINGVTLPLAPGANVDADVVAGAEVGVRLVVTASGAIAVTEVTLADCGDVAPIEGGPSASASASDDGGADPSSTASASNGGGGGVEPTMTLPQSSTDTAVRAAGTAPIGSVLAALFLLALLTVALAHPRLLRRMR